MDIMVGQLFNPRKLRVLTVVDICTRLCPAIGVAHAYKGYDAVATLPVVQRWGRAYRSTDSTHYRRRGGADDMQRSKTAPRYGVATPGFGMGYASGEDGYGIGVGVGVGVGVTVGVVMMVADPLTRLFNV